VFVTAATVVALGRRLCGWRLWRARSGGTRDGDGVDGSRGGDDAGDGTRFANRRLRGVFCNPRRTRGRLLLLSARARERGCARGDPEHGRAAPRPCSR